MEIRSVANEIKNDYPKLEQVSKKHLSSNLPSKWIKAGLSSLGMAIIMQSNVFASSIDSDTTTLVDLAGDVPVSIVVPLPVKICDVACPIVQVVSAIVFVITGLSILITKMKSKNQPEPIKVKKWIKITFIISIIAFILSILAQFIVNAMY